MFFSILDFENYYTDRFLFLFSILIKLFDHEIVNCEIIHDVSMLIYILTSENVKNYDKIAKFLNFFQSYNKKFFQNLHFLKFQKGTPFEKKLRQRVPPMVLKFGISRAKGSPLA